MHTSPLHVTYIGGPTALIEFGGLRFLTDPTLDPAGTEYPTAAYTLHKTVAPALPLAAFAPIDCVLLSHDHHFDNLDRSGRIALAMAGRTFTTLEGAARLGEGTTGLRPWEAVELPSPTGGMLRLTATPARHGPAGGDRGPVIGFVLQELEDPGQALYFSGDTVWYDGVAEVGRRFAITVALLNLGAAKVAVAGPDALTFTAADALVVAESWPGTLIVPLHFEGWAHFTEGRAVVDDSFGAAGMRHRLRWLVPGQPTSLP